MHPTLAVLRDDENAIAATLSRAATDHDALITSGGAWWGDRDCVCRTLDFLGWEKKFHRIRMGPGKAVGFGVLKNKPVFVLPGGPPSNLTAFLEVALPGLLRLSGHGSPRLPEMRVKLCGELTGRSVHWTEFVYGRLGTEHEPALFHPLGMMSRLKTIAAADSVVAIPEGVQSLAAGAFTTAFNAGSGGIMKTGVRWCQYRAGAGCW